MHNSFFKLPRPPVYALPSESLFDRELSKELRLWNELHYSIKTYTLLLQRTNRLNVVLQQTTAWLCRLNVDFEVKLIELKLIKMHAFLDRNSISYRVGIDATWFGRFRTISTRFTRGASDKLSGRVMLGNSM